MKKYFILLFLVECLFARSLFVKPLGSDSNTGLDTTVALQTIQKAVSIAQLGDTVNVMNGRYLSQSPTNSLCYIEYKGNENAWLVIKNYPGHSPLLIAKTYCFGSLSGCFFEIRGFEMIGYKDSTTKVYADTHSVWGSGVCFSPYNNGHVHHAKIIDNIIHGFIGSGIACNGCDYITIDSNIVYDNAWYSDNANSGINICNSWNYDSIIRTRITVSRNIIYNNKSIVRWKATGNLSDGNGLIFDHVKYAYENTNPIVTTVYRGKSVIIDNLIFNNGACGINIFRSDNVSVYNNTVCKNNTVLPWKEISSSQSTNIVIFKNYVIDSLCVLNQ